MKIKTVFDQSAAAFDAEVNEALADGWRLVRRFSDLPRAFIAELVLPDEPEAPPEPRPRDPFDALRVVRDFCDAHKCEGCPLIDWCSRHLPRNEGPADWTIYGEEAPKA